MTFLGGVRSYPPHQLTAVDAHNQLVLGPNGIRATCATCSWCCRGPTGAGLGCRIAERESTAWPPYAVSSKSPRRVLSSSDGIPGQLRGPGHTVSTIIRGQSQNIPERPDS